MDGSRSGMIAAAGMSDPLAQSRRPSPDVVALGALPGVASAADLERFSAFVVDGSAPDDAVAALLRFAATAEFRNRFILFLGDACHGQAIAPSAVARCLFLESGLEMSQALWVARFMTADRDDPIVFGPAPEVPVFRAALHVRTLDDVERCTKLVGALLKLDVTASIGLRELVLNAVEHGNLGITYQEKSRLLESGNWYQEVLRRLGLPQQETRYASLQIESRPGFQQIVIRDQGKGFDWQSYVAENVVPTASRHGRGISMAIGADFDAVEYRGCGNEVVLTVGRTRSA